MARRREPLVVEISGSMTVKDLAERLNVGPAPVIKELINNGILANINQTVDRTTAVAVARSLGVEVKEPEEAEVVEQEVATRAPDQSGRVVIRPPVVTIMGHVDHGKTSLLDAIRTADVAAREAGGITQHIGAYQVEIRGQKITFLDTPGHEAFTAMRARGAQATDIAILVVAADDGVQPQTLEAIDHARAARVPIIVAINKIDRADAQPDRVKQQLADAGLIVEGWGGDVVAVPVSARRKEGIETLLEMILLVAELGELKADPDRPASGVVIEAKIDKTRGPVATVLVQQGTAKIGDNIVAGSISGKIRAMFNDSGKRVKKAEPSTPVEILGFVGVPEAGDVFRVTADERTARQEAEAARRDGADGTGQPGSSLEAVSSSVSAGETKDLNIVIKTDVQGSVEPIVASLERLSTEKVKVQILRAGSGSITESDVLLAQASGAVIVGFNVRVEPGAKHAADQQNVEIRMYSVIYELIEDVEKAVSGLLEPELVEIVEGHAEVRQIFRVGRTDVIAGCFMLDGRIGRTSSVRVRRSGSIAFEGKIGSLRRFKDDVREVLAGYECGIGIDGFLTFEVGDILESFRIDKAS